MKTTKNGRRPQKIKSGIYQQLLIGPFSNIKLKPMKMKTTTNGRQPQNIKSGIPQQPLYGSSLRGNLEFGSAHPSLFYSPNCHSPTQLELE